MKYPVQRVNQFYEVSEHLPEEGVLKWVYSEVWGYYYIAKWTASQGWVDQDGDHIKIITHWCDLELPMPFPSSGSYNEDVAVKYDFKRYNSN